VPLLGQHVLVLLGVLYAFAVVGMAAFAGVLRADDAAVARSSFGEYNYFSLINFDSLPNALFALFYLLTVNDWVVLMEGCVAAVGKSARAFFFVFWPVLVLFLLNVIIAFITVAFGAEKERRDAAAAARAAGGTLYLQQGRGVNDWRHDLRGHVGGWLVMRAPRLTDVYDGLYREDLAGAFPDTLGGLHLRDGEHERGGRGGGGS
jgi:hypothetical protein